MLKDFLLFWWITSIYIISIFIINISNNSLITKLKKECEEKEDRYKYIIRKRDKTINVLKQRIVRRDRKINKLLTK